MDDTLNQYLVFSIRPDSVSEAEYDQWYELHAKENMLSPGFVRARRYGTRQVVDGAPTGPEQHLAVYDFEGDMARWRADLTARLSSGEIELPSWFSQIQFTSWVSTPRSGLLRPDRD